jgi:hypothetical protein
MNSAIIAEVAQELIKGGKGIRIYINIRYVWSLVFILADNYFSRLLLVILINQSFRLSTFIDRNLVQCGFTFLLLFHSETRQCLGSNNREYALSL